jgi:Zn-dependent peptidase ImmA (M78 family)/DNA-binding XRE family transcriptional regulator
MLLLARESRGYSQQELADKIGMSSTAISKMEAHELNVSAETLRLIAEATNYPVSFFDQEVEVVPENVAYRKRATVAQKLLTPIASKVNILRFNIQQLTRELSIPVPELPVLNISDDTDPATLAKALQKVWDIQPPTIDHLTALIESKGIAVASFDFETERVDSRSIFTDDRYPIIVLNSTMLGDRLRFSLAYELGHLLMHASNDAAWDRDVSHEANLFAAELLMPEQAIRDDFKDGVTLPLLANLKKKWKVSMISLLYRADDLGFVTPNQKRYLLGQFNTMGIRRREPLDLDVAKEFPQLISGWLKSYEKKHDLNPEVLAASLHLSLNDFNSYYRH